MRNTQWLALILSLLTLMNGAAAKDKTSDVLSKQNPHLNKSQAASIVQQQLGGKILKVEARQKNGKEGFRVKILQTSGHIKHVWVDANSGKVF